MLSWAPLRAVCLASLLLSWIGYSVIAIPVPIHPIDLHPETGSRFTSNTDGRHQTRLQQHANLPPHQQAHPGAVTAHAVPNPNGQAGHGHLMGSVVTDTNSQHHMNSRTLAAHVDHIDQTLGRGRYKIDAHHTEGNAHVMFHATPLHHDALQPPHQGVRHAVLNPGDNPSNVLVRSPSGHRATISHQLDTKIHPQDGSQPHPHFQMNQAGGAIRGSIPIAHENHRHGMTDRDLQAHAHYVHDLVAQQHPHLQEKLHVHVTHADGAGHVNFHVVPGQQSVSPAEVQAHLNKQGNSHYQGGPIAHDRHSNLQNPHVDHKFTWHGTVPAHSTAQLSPQELRVYAEHAKNQIIAHNNLQGPDAQNMVLAAVHKEGDTHVHFHTQPTQSLVMNRNQGLNPGRPGQQTVDPLARKISNEISAANGGQAPWHHAESGALYDSLKDKGVHNNMASFDHHVQGHAVGVAGAWNQPCPTCRNTLNRLGVNY